MGRRRGGAAACAANPGGPQSRPPDFRPPRRPKPPPPPLEGDEDEPTSRQRTPFWGAEQDGLCDESPTLARERVPPPPALEPATFPNRRPSVAKKAVSPPPGPFEKGKRACHPHPSAVFPPRKSTAAVTDRREERRLRNAHHRPRKPVSQRGEGNTTKKAACSPPLCLLQPKARQQCEKNVSQRKTADSGSLVSGNAPYFAVLPPEITLTLAKPMPLAPRKGWRPGLGRELSPWRRCKRAATDPRWVIVFMDPSRHCKREARLVRTKSRRPTPGLCAPPAPWLPR
jgi:hypothetical protein